MRSQFIAALVISWALPVLAEGTHRLDIVLPLESVKQYKRIDGSKIRRYFRNKNFNFSGAQVSVNSSELQPAQIEFRGQTCEAERRPCLGLELENKVKIGSEVSGKKFNLNSLIGDKGYINNKIGFGLVRKMGLDVAPQEYVEVVMRDASNTLIFNMGLYLIMEKPVQFAIKKMKAEFVARKRYKYVESKKFSDELTLKKEIYEKTLNDIFLASTYQQWEGQDFLNRLEHKMDIEAYLKWLALNSLLRNGDYSDEIFFIGTPQGLKGAEEPFYKILPWDYDDLFAQIHSIPLYTKSCDDFEWAPIYNCESPLDRAIILDPVTYKRLLEVFKETYENVLTPSLTDEHLEQVFQELNPYLQIAAVRVAAEKDGRSLEYTSDSIHRLIEGRKAALHARRNHLLRQVKSELQRLK